MTKAPSTREVSNRWYGGLAEGDYQNTPEDFLKFLEQEVLPQVPSEGLPTFLGGLQRWIPDQKTTIESLSHSHPTVRTLPGRESRALVIVDMQNGFAKKGGLIYVEQAEQQIPTIQRTIQMARSKHLPVIYTRVRWESSENIVTGLKNNLPSLEEKWDSEGGFCPGTWGSEIVDELKPEDDDHVTDKRAFHPPDLVELLRQNEPDVEEVFVVGTTANNCVYAACLALFEAGYEVKAIRDGISSFDESFREPWLANIDKYLGDVISIGEFEAAFSRMSPAASTRPPSVRS